MAKLHTLTVTAHPTGFGGALTCTDSNGKIVPCTVTLSQAGNLPAIGSTIKAITARSLQTVRCGGPVNGWKESRAIGAVFYIMA